jgi:hypothetical protein
MTSQGRNKKGIIEEEEKKEKNELRRQNRK